MFKYIKWIGLLIILILMSVLTIKFINFLQSDKNDNIIINDGFIIDDSKDFNIVDIYNIPLYKTGAAYYENGELISENLQLVDARSMIFYKDYVEYIDPNNDNRDKYIYKYENGIIDINSEDYFLVNGVYNITYENNKVKILQTEDNKTYVYYFDIKENK